jgi:hypothetical protein
MPVQTRRSAQKQATQKTEGPAISHLPESGTARQSQASSRTKRSNDASIGSAAVSGTKKKTKTSDSASKASVAPSISTSLDIASYNLRSSARKAPAPAAATVTPANATSRRLAPFETPPTLASIDLAHSNNNALMPPGVVDIYDPRQSCYSFHRTCNCPANCSFEQGTDIAFAYLAHYGQDFGEVMKERETTEMAQHLARIPQESDSDDDEDDENKENTSRRSQRNKSDEDSKSSSSSSSKYTPPPNAKAKFRPRELELHLSGTSMDDDDETSSPPSQMLPRQYELTTSMRTMLVNWMVEVCKEYNISDDALHLSITLVDRALLMGPTEEDYEGGWMSSEYLFVPKSSFQALGW